jgi:nucleoside-diphosphate-sugar epimerase
MNLKNGLLTKVEIDSISNRAVLDIFQGKSILITGGTGMIGSYFVEALCSACELQGVKPKEIHLITRQPDYLKLGSLEKYKYVTFGDSRAFRGTHKKGFQYLIHAASPASPTNFPSLSELIEVNAGFLSTMITAETEKVLYVSSGEVYGAKSPVPVSEEYVGKIDPLAPRSPYPLAKIEAERVGFELCSNFGIDLKIVRLFHSFGPGVREDDGRSFADFLWQCARGKDPLLLSEGKDIRTFLYSEDAITAMFNIMASDKAIGPINVGSEHPVTIREFATRISEIGGLRGKLLHRIKNQDYVASPNHIIIPNTLKLKELGWKQEVNLDDAICRTLEWIKRQIA